MEEGESHAFNRKSGVHKTMHLFSIALRPQGNGILTQ